MYPVRALNLNEAWERLSEHKPDQWKEIEEALRAITPEELEKATFRMYRDIDEPRLIGDIVRAWDYYIKKYKWASARRFSNSVNIKFVGHYIKNNVSCRVHVSSTIGTNQFINDVLANIPLAQKLNVADIFVLLVPADDYVELYKDQRIPSYLLLERRCREQVKDIRYMNIIAPILIVFFSSKYEEFSVENIEMPKLVLDETTVIRSIEFEPEYYQAGVGVLSYFGQVLRQKYPNMHAKVKIEQDGSVVRMHIETPSGDVEVIEKELEKYALVIAEQASPDTLFENKAYALQLESRLDIAKLEIKHAQTTLQLTQSMYEQRIVSLEEQMRSMGQQLATHLIQKDKLIDVTAQLTSSHTQLQLAQINQSNTLFKDLLGEAQGNQAVIEAVRSLQHALMSGIATIDMDDKVGAALATIKQEQPSLLSRIAGQVESAGYGALAGPVLEWMSKHMPQ